jgi:hypothetical protein
MSCLADDQYIRFRHLDFNYIRCLLHHIIRRPGLIDAENLKNSFQDIYPYHL